MFCKNCGKEIKDGVAFCSECGAKIESANGGSATVENTTKTDASVEENRNISRESYIGKAYVFDYYIGLNIPSFRLSRRAVGFNDDHLLYCKGLHKIQIPYGVISKIEEKTKTSPYVISCFVFFVIVGIIALICGGVAVALVAAVMAVLSIIFRKYREISIITTDNKVFKIKVVPKNKEIDEFFTYLKSETGIK